jgi:hypothetical protein
MSALALLTDFQPSLGCDLRQPLSYPLGSEQRDALPPKPLLRDPHQLLKCVIPRLAK